jgi:hypothetical protein
MRPARLGDPEADAPEWWRGTRSLRRVPIIAFVIITIIFIRATAGSSPPPLTKSCTTPAFALSTYDSPVHKTVQWSATGPPGMHFELTIGVSHFDVAPDGTLVTVPDPGLVTKDVQAASAKLTMGNSCKAHNTFGIVVPARTYSVRMFTLTGTPSNPTATVVAEKTLKVTER